MLYFVATPIGNLKDITYRAVEVLNSVDIIACEDTRHSITLLNFYNIKKPLVAYHKFNEKESGEEIIEKLKAGKNIAVISDAGMPVVSDPGNVLVNMLIENGLEYTIIPGASAFTSALVLSGLYSREFCFLGFLPEKQKERKELLERYLKVSATLIFYSAPQDVDKDVATLYECLGDRSACLVKEITKIHESAVRFNLKDGIVGDHKGEHVILVSGYMGKADDDESLSNEQLIDKFMGEGLDKKQALKKVAGIRGIPKSELYKYTIGK